MELVLAMPPGSESSEFAKINVSETIFGRDFNEPLIHQVITAYLAGERSGTRAQKTRGEVRGGGRKPWRQKGTGNARAGTITSPVWRKGGVTFAAKPQDHSQKINRKMYRGAVCSILSELVRQIRLVVIKEQDIIPNKPKTKDLLNILKSYNLDEALIIVNSWNDNLYLASRNVPKINVCHVNNISPVNLIKFGKVVITAEALAKLEEALK